MRPVSVMSIITKMMSPGWCLCLESAVWSSMLLHHRCGGQHGENGTAIMSPDLQPPGSPQDTAPAVLEAAPKTMRGSTTTETQSGPSW